MNRLISLPPSCFSLKEPFCTCVVEKVSLILERRRTMLSLIWERDSDPLLLHLTYLSTGDKLQLFSLNSISASILFLLGSLLKGPQRYLDLDCVNCLLSKTYITALTSKRWNSFLRSCSWSIILKIGSNKLFISFLDQMIIFYL